MVKLELDHIFCFCSKELNEVTIAEKAYFPTRSIFIHKSNEAEPAQPLVFVMPIHEKLSLESMRPVNFTQLNKSLLLLL